MIQDFKFAPLVFDGLETFHSAGAMEHEMTAKLWYLKSNVLIKKLVETGKSCNGKLEFTKRWRSFIDVGR